MICPASHKTTQVWLEIKTPNFQSLLCYTNLFICFAVKKN